VSYAIAAAGTGGHLYPALAVATELVERGVPRSEIVFIGGDRLEATLVPEAGFDLIAVAIRGLRRSLAPSNLALPFVVRRAARDIAVELRQRRVGSLLVMGGYISVPAAMAARRCDVPFIVHEQNGRPGLANRMVARRAARVLVAFPQALAKLARSQLVGNPLRRSLVELDKEARRGAARRRYELEATGPVLGVMGGSQGALAINEAISTYAATAHRPPIVHLVGPGHITAMRQLAEGSQIPWRIVGFENSMEDFYAACDLVVARAGAGTVSELAVTGTPAVLVPLEAVAQQDNAAHLAAAGAAVVLKQADLRSLGGEIDRLIDDAGALAAMSQAARRAGHPGAAAAVADALMESVRG
jgi:UDP-N-acetylglucosamine--N-acetylmuramyl-(pentapeptide) pyrophosphoryl-undecaprenol N-acetylglucosamine transferase